MTSTSSVTLSTMQVSSINTTDAGKKVVHLQQLDPYSSSYQQKEIVQQKASVSPCQEITKALVAGDFTKFTPWLKQKGWSDETIKELEQRYDVAKMFRPNSSAEAIHSELLRQAVKKENLEVFKTVPMTFLEDIREVASLIDLLKEKMRMFPEKEVYKEMDAVVQKVTPKDQYLLFQKSQLITPNFFNV